MMYIDEKRIEKILKSLKTKFVIWTMLILISIYGIISGIMGNADLADGRITYIQIIAIFTPIAYLNLKKSDLIKSSYIYNNIFISDADGYINISELGSKLGKTNSKVAKEVQKLMHLKILTNLSLELGTEQRIVLRNPKIDNLSYESIDCPYCGARVTKRAGFIAKCDYCDAEIKWLKMNMLDNKARIIISTLKENSYDAYIVGGYLRDIILGNISHDIDITTDALPNEVINIFKDKYKVIETGIKYGTVTVIIENTPIEITTYRSEERYADGRHPQKIRFEKNIVDDLSRRDFTINAMAYNDEKGLIDIFNSKDDLDKKIIRSVGEPIRRFEDDKLRMLRAIRFASQLDFEIEKDTFCAIKKLSHKITDISIERINLELTKMLLTKKPSKAMILMYESRLLNHILPVIDEMYGFNQQNPYHKKDLFFHTMEVLDKTKDDIILRLSALFHDTGKLYTKTVDKNNIGHFYGHNKISAEITKTYLKKLRYPNATINLVSLLVEKHMIDANSITKKGIRKLISIFGKEDIYYLVKLQKADSSSTALGESNLFEEKLKQVLEEESAFTLNDLDINGLDIKNLGYEGKKIGEIKNYLLEIVLDNPKLNRKDILLEKIKENF